MSRALNRYHLQGSQGCRCISISDNRSPGQELEPGRCGSIAPQVKFQVVSVTTKTVADKTGAFVLYRRTRRDDIADSSLGCSFSGCLDDRTVHQLLVAVISWKIGMVRIPGIGPGLMEDKLHPGICSVFPYIGCQLVEVGETGVQKTGIGAVLLKGDIIPPLVGYSLHQGGLLGHSQLARGIDLTVLVIGLVVLCVLPMPLQ